MRIKEKQIRLEQALAGSMEERREQLRAATRQYLPEIDAAYAAENVWAYLVGTFSDHVVVEVNGPELKTAYWQIDYTAEGQGAATLYTFANPVAVEWTVEPVKAVADAGQPATPAAPAEPAPAQTQGVAPDPVDAVLTEAERAAAERPEIHNVILENGQVAFGSKLLLTESRESALAKLKAGVMPKGRAALMVAGVATSNGAVYTVACCKALVADLRAAITEGQNFIHRGPWPTGAMYPTHDAALNEGSNRLTSAAAKFTSVYISGGKTIDQIADGDVIGVTFEMLSTQAGQDTAAVLLETNWVGGLSLRGFSVQEKHEADGLVYVDRMDPMGFGGDFVQSFAAQFPSREAARVVLEGEDGKGKTMKLEDLLKEHPELKPQFEAAEKANARLAVLEEESIRGSKEKTVTAVIEHFTPVLKSVNGLKEEDLKEVITECRPLVESAVTTILTERPEIAGQSLVDATVARCEATFAKKRDHYARVIGQGVRAAMESARIPAGAVAEDVPGVGGVSGGGPRMESVPFINTLNGPALLIESQNERVGLPRGVKDAHGRLRAARLTDVVLAESFDLPMYEQDEATKSPIHVIDKYRPGLRAKIERMSKVYMDQPFFIEGARGITDRQLFAMEEYKQLRAAMLRRETGESTVSNTLPTLLPDVRQAVLEAMYFTSLFLTIATIEPTNAPTYTIRYEDVRRQGEWKFGSLAQGGSFSTSGDEGALTVADRVFLKVTTLTATACTITVTYTNQNGTSKTGTVVVPDASTVDTVIEFYPTPGELVLDISGATASGWSAGAVNFIAFDPVSAATETAISGKARTYLTEVSGATEEIDLASEITWRLMQDANNAALGQSWDVVARHIANLVNELTDHLDRIGFKELNAAVLSRNTISFDATTIPAGMTEAEHKATLLEQHYLLRRLIKQSSTKFPDWELVNYGDEPKLLWMTRDVIRPSTVRAEAFFKGQGWGTVAGAQSYIADHQNHQRLLMGSRGFVFHCPYIPLQIMGPIPYVGASKGNTYIASSRHKNVCARNETRGYIQITE